VLGIEAAVKKAIVDSVRELTGIDLEEEAGKPDMNRARFEALLEKVYEAGMREQERRCNYRVRDLQQLMDLLPDHVYFKDLESRFTSVNPAHALHLGLNNPEEAIGKTDFDFFREEYARAKYESEQEIIRTGKGFSFREEHHFQQSGKEQWALSTKLPLYDEHGNISGIFGLSRNITDKKLAEIELERQKGLLETIVEILPGRVFVRDLQGRYVLVNEEYRKWIEVDSEEPVEGKKINAYLNREKVRRISREDREIMTTGRPILNQVQHDEISRKRNSWILTSKVPLRNKSNEIEGLVGMALDITEAKEAEQRARTAQAALLEKNRQMEAELQIARQLQERLLSEGFEADRSMRRHGFNWDMNAHYLYWASHHLAGDFFFVLPLGGDQVGVIICDVMGHGVKAALVTTLIRGLLLEIPQALKNPSAVLTFLNQKLWKLARNSDFPRFVTACYAVLDMGSGSLTLAGAGHPVPLWQYRADHGEAMEKVPLRSMGAALGLQESSVYEETELVLQSRTRLYLYTDGIIELENKEGEEFGLDRFISILESRSGEGPVEISKAISEAINRFARDRDLGDDICIVCLEAVPHDTR